MEALSNALSENILKIVWKYAIRPLVTPIEANPVQSHPIARVHV